MPGLLRGVARTAVVAGTASAVSGRVQRRQAEKFADRDQAIAANRGAGYAEGYESQQQYAQAPAPAPAPAAAEDPVEQLQKLGELHSQGILSDEEFAAAKAKILG
jgi:hypothetical protein